MVQSPCIDTGIAGVDVRDDLARVLPRRKVSPDHLINANTLRPCDVDDKPILGLSRQARRFGSRRPVSHSHELYPGYPVGRMPKHHDSRPGLARERLLLFVAFPSMCIRDLTGRPSLTVPPVRWQAWAGPATSVKP
jgi:hypothetical protein